MGKLCDIYSVSVCVKHRLLFVTFFSVTFDSVCFNPGSFISDISVTGLTVSVPG